MKHRNVLLILQGVDDAIRVVSKITAQDEARLKELLSSQEKVAKHVFCPELTVLFKTKAGSLIVMNSTP